MLDASTIEALDELLAAKLAPHLLAFEAANPWRADALCLEYPDLDWFPNRGEATREQKAVCGRCLVQRECREYAMTHGIKVGLWGATSERDRRRLRTRSDPQPKPGAVAA